MNDLTKKLLELNAAPVFIKNERGVYIGCNYAFENFLGLSRNQILGQTAFNIAPASLANSYCLADKELFARRSVQIYKSPVIAANCEEKTVIFSKTIFFDEGDVMGGFIGSIDNVINPQSRNEIGQQANRSAVNLTNREIEVLYLVAKGFSSKEIARHLLLSNHTISDYMKSIFTKLNCNNRVSAIVKAKQLSLI